MPSLTLTVLSELGAAPGALSARALAALRGSCRRAKVELSEETEVDVDLSPPDLRGLGGPVRLTRETLEALIAPLLQRANDVVAQVRWRC
jgi:molecular chaperone DnaK (HSP70)